MTNLFTNLSNWKLKYICTLVMLLCIGVGNAWGTDPAVDDVIFEENFGDWGANKTDFDQCTTLSDYNKRGTVCWVAADKSGISFSTDGNAKGTTSIGGNCTSGHIWVLKNTTGYFTISGIPLYTNNGVKKVEVTWSQGGGSSMTCTYAFDGGNTWNSAGSTSTAGATVPSSPTEITVTGHSTIALKFTRTSTKTNIRIDNIKITVTEVAAASCTTNPTVSGAGNSSITSTTARVSCSSGISSLGSAGCSISSYGFVIGSSANPSIGGSGVTKHEVGTSYTTTGTSFYKDLTGLTPGSTYYVRSYATNGNGSGYGTQTSFTMLNEYTLTFKEYVGGAAASGSPSTGKVVENATSFSFGATAPSKTGYKIEGFYTDQSANSGVKVANASRAFVASVASWTDKDSKYTKGANANIYVNWQAKQSAITFDKNDGTGGDNSTTATYGSAMPTVSVPTRAGYNFDGYYDAETDGNGSGNKYYNANGTSAANWNKDTEAATTLYAKWTPKTLNITWDANGVSWSGSDHGTPSTTVTYGSKISTFPTSPAKAQCDGSKEFVGWTLTPIVGTTNTKPTFVSPQTTITETGDFTLYAVFATRTANSFTKGDINDLINGKEVIIHNAGRNYALSNSGSSGRLTAVSVTPSTNVISSSEASIRWIVQNNGTNYYFKSSTNYLYASSAANTNLYCGATLDYWTIGSYNSAYYLYSNTSTSSYKMEAYYSNTNGAFFTTYSQSSSTPGADYQMQFYVPTYSAYQTACCSRKAITLASSGSVTGGSFSTSVSSACEDAEVTLTATPSSKEYVFNAWTVTETADPTNDITSTNVDDNTLTMPNFAVTVNASFSAISSIAVKTAPTKTTYCAGDNFDPAGLVVTATYANSATQDISYASDAALFTFSPATNASLATNNSSVTITVGGQSASQSITVNALRTISLTGSGTVTGGTFEADESSACVGATITLTPSASSHYSFTSWTITKAGGGTVTPVGNTFTMPDDNVTVNATFTEDAHHFVTFKNDLTAVSGYDHVKVYDGTKPTPPTMTDVTDACDKSECTLFYGWIAEAGIWDETLDDISDKTIYRSASSLPNVSGADVTYHAVWAKGTAAPTINSTLIAKWDKQALTAGTAVKAKDKDGNTLNGTTLTISNLSLNSDAIYCYSKAASIGAYPVITISGLDFSAYSSGVITFFARGSQNAKLTAEYSTNDGVSFSDLDWEDYAGGKEYGFIIDVPNTTTDVRISYASNTGNFYFGTVRAYGENSSTSYTFEELTSSNASGWSGSDWDGYYLITATKDTKTYALRSDVMEGLYGYAEVSPSEGSINTYDLGMVFKVTYNSSTSKYAIQSAATLDYLTDDPAGVSEKYHLLETSATEAISIAYNQITHTTSYYVQWNSDRFGSYTSSTAPTLYKILSSYSKWRISCCEKNNINKDGTPAGTVTGGTFTADKTSACAEATITLSVTSTSSGYNFDEWEVTGDESSDKITVTDNTFEMPDEAVTVTAKFKTAHTTTVTLNPQEGTGGTASVTATVNLPMPDATMPTKSGYDFGGYYLATNGSGTQYYDADGNSAHDWDNGEDDTEVLYAKWTAKGYTVTLNEEGATTQGTSSVSVTYGANTNLTSAITCPTYTNKVFGGYWTTASGEGTQLIDGDGNWIPNVTSYTGSNKQWLYANDIELHARWSNVSYTNYRTTCGPEIEVTVSGTVHLTTYAGCEVLTPSTSLITVSSDDWKSKADALTFLRFRLKDKVSGVTYSHTSSSDEGSTQKIANSEFRVNHASGNGGSYADNGYISIPAGTTDSTFSFRIAYTPTSGSYNTTDHYILEVEAMDNSATKKTITLEVLDLYGRTLPQEFVIAVKKDDNWYALPNNLPSTSTAAKATAAIPIVVDNETTPSCAMYAPENVLYKATGYYTAPVVASRNRSGVRFTRNGSQYLQVSTTAGTNTMWLSTTGGADVQDWYLNSSNFQSYELKMDPRAGTGGYKDKKMGMLGSNFGFYSSPTAYDIYLLPVENTLEEASAVEWGKNSLVLDVDAGSYSHVIARVGSTATGALSFSQTRTSSKGSASANTYTINVGNTINFDEKADQLLYLDWLNGSGSVVGVSMVTIPWIINGTKTMSVVDATKGHWANAEVHVLPGATLTADAGTFSNVTIKQLEIYPGATVQVTTGELTTTNLMLRNGWSRAGEKRYDAARLYITPSTGTLKATNVFADWYIDYDQYYPVSVPWIVTTSGITYLNTSNAATGGVKLRYYDGNSRATNVQEGVGSGVNWKEYSPWPETMNPGMGYAMTARRPTGKAFSVVRLPLSLPSGAWTSGTWTANGEKGDVTIEAVTKHKDQVAVKAWGVDDDSKPRYAVGWNFIAQPYMSLYQGPITHSEGSDYDVEVVNIPDIQFKEYDQYAVGALGQKLLPAGGFFIQTEKDGALTFGTTNRKASAPSYRKETQNLTNKQKAYIVLNDEENEDMMGLLVSDHYTVDYDINGDFEKLMGDGTSLKTYMRYNEMNMAYVAINEELAREWIPVTVRIPENGEYTYSLHEASIAGDLEGVYLIDYQNGDLITNLLDNNYTFYSPAGTISGRFAINAIVGKHDTPTSIDIINAGGDIHSDKPVKFLFRDKVFILHQGVIYDSTGKKVKGGK